MCLLPTFAFGEERLINCMALEDGEAYKLVYNDEEVILKSSDPAFDLGVTINHEKINDRFLIGTIAEANIPADVKAGAGDWGLFIFSLDTEKLTIEIGGLNLGDKEYFHISTMNCFEVVN
jgi:hypothetical protein